MILKKFAAVAIIFTTATGLFMEPVSSITTVPNKVFASGIIAEGDENGLTQGVTGTENNSATDNSTVATDINITEAGTTDTGVVENTKDNTESDSTSNSKKENNNKKTKTKAKKTKVKIQIAKTKARRNYSSSDLKLMSSIINCEAGIEPYQGKIAVGIVVMNRIKSKSFPNTLEGVIYQSGQFSPVRNGSLRKRLAQYNSGRINSRQWKSCISAARKVLNGQRTIIYNGRTKNMSDYHFFSVGLRGARLSLGGHKFK